MTELNSQDMAQLMRDADSIRESMATIAESLQLITREIVAANRTKGIYPDD